MTDETILAFPIQQRSLDASMPVEEAVRLAKLKVIHYMAQVEAGKATLDDDKIASIEWINELCEKYGFEPLDYEFDTR